MYGFGLGSLFDSYPGTSRMTVVPASPHSCELCIDATVELTDGNGAYLSTWTYIQWSK